MAFETASERRRVTLVVPVFSLSVADTTGDLFRTTLLKCKNNCKYIFQHFRYSNSHCQRTNGFMTI